MAVVAILVASSMLLVGNVGIQSADAGSDTNCHSKSGTATIDPNVPNAVDINTLTQDTTNGLSEPRYHTLFTKYSSHRFK